MGLPDPTGTNPPQTSSPYAQPPHDRLALGHCALLSLSIAVASATLADPRILILDKDTAVGPTRQFLEIAHPENTHLGDYP
jgi:hypothetical protein